MRELYQDQMRRDKLFLHEHPAEADSWSESCIRKVMRLEAVQTMTMHQCQFGQMTADGQPIKKGTRWMSNCRGIPHRLDKQCAGRGGVCSFSGTPHAVCSCETAREAALYPFKLCRAILMGFGDYLDEKEIASTTMA